MPQIKNPLIVSAGNGDLPSDSPTITMAGSGTLTKNKPVWLEMGEQVGSSISPINDNSYDFGGFVVHLSPTKAIAKFNNTSTSYSRAAYFSVFDYSETEGFTYGTPLYVSGGATRSSGYSQTITLSNDRFLEISNGAQLFLYKVENNTVTLLNQNSPSSDIISTPSNNQPWGGLVSLGGNSAYLTSARINTTSKKVFLYITKIDIVNDTITLGQSLLLWQSEVQYTGGTISGPLTTIQMNDRLIMSINAYPSRPLLLVDISGDTPTLIEETTAQGELYQGLKISDDIAFTSYNFIKIENDTLVQYNDHRTIYFSSEFDLGGPNIKLLLRTTNRSLADVVIGTKDAGYFMSNFSIYGYDTGGSYTPSAIGLLGDNIIMSNKSTSSSKTVLYTYKLLRTNFPSTKNTRKAAYIGIAKNAADAQDLAEVVVPV